VGTKSCAGFHLEDNTKILKYGACHYFLFIVELVEAIKSKVVRLCGRLYGCSDCDYTTSYSSTIGNHIEAKHLSKLR
jgi:hypothetical protein